MGKNSSIEWTHHTFNPWWGCDKVSPACKNCYAEAWAKRVGAAVWGSAAPRRFFGDEHWRQPLSWNKEAQNRQQRSRVFCASMADVFEDRADVEAARQRPWKLIDQTSSLDWLLLTKRPHLVSKLAPWSQSWPGNVWLGTTVENQRWAAKRIPALLAVGAKRRFLSCEPLLGAVDLSPFQVTERLHWIIAGGESGTHARPSHPDWFRNLREQCRMYRISFHFKQWGSWTPTNLQERTGGAIKTIAMNGNTVDMVRVPKKVGGRILDGEQWDQVPSSAA